MNSADNVCRPKIDQAKENYPVKKVTDVHVASANAGTGMRQESYVLDQERAIKKWCVLRVPIAVNLFSLIQSFWRG